MPIQIERPIPLEKTLVMRSALVALSVNKAKIFLYNEQIGEISATIPRFLGFSNGTVSVSVNQHEDNRSSDLILSAPDLKVLEGFYAQITEYLTKGYNSVITDVVKAWQGLKSSARRLPSLGNRKPSRG